MRVTDHDQFDFQFACHAADFAHRIAGHQMTFGTHAARVELRQAIPEHFGEAFVFLFLRHVGDEAFGHEKRGCDRCNRQQVDLRLQKIVDVGTFEQRTTTGLRAIVGEQHLAVHEGSSLSIDDRLILPRVSGQRRAASPATGTLPCPLTRASRTDRPHHAKPSTAGNCCSGSSSASRALRLRCRSSRPSCS
jgi:hypothetical protein